MRTHPVRYEPLLWRINGIAAMLQRQKAINDVLSAPTIRRTTLAQRIYEMFLVERDTTAETKLTASGYSPRQVYRGTFVAEQDATTVAAFARKEGWTPSPQRANRWNGPTGGAQVDGDMVTFIVYAEPLAQAA